MNVLPQWAAVTSHYSFMHGVASPTELATACADAGWSGVSLIDRDGLWGATKFLRATQTVGIAANVGVSCLTLPICDQYGRAHNPLGSAQLADSWQMSGPTGRAVVADAPRCVAFGATATWPALVRLFSAAITGATRPVFTTELLQEFTAAGGVVGFGAGSEVAQAFLRGDPAAAQVLAAWRDRLNGQVAVLVSTDSAISPESLRLATRLATCGYAHDVPVVFTPHFRWLTPAGRVPAHLLAAITQKQALPTTPNPAPAHVLSAVAAAKCVAAIGHATQGDHGTHLLAQSADWWADRVVDPPATMGFGRVHPPEDQVITASGLTSPDPASSDVVLRDRCHAAIPTWYGQHSDQRLNAVRDQLDQELRVIRRLGYAAFFLTVATVADLARDLGIRSQARGSSVGSLVVHLLGLSPIDPIGEELLMERFCTTLRTDLPDIDLDVESARRHEVYEAAFAHFGTERVAAVGMIDAYRARSAIRDVGAAFGVAPDRVAQLAKAAPWHGSGDIWQDFAALPELRTRRLVTEADRGWLAVAGLLARLPRHASMHPCGVIMSDAGLLDRVAVQGTGFAWPMAQVDKHDVDDLGLLKVDILGVRMHSAMAHAVDLVAERTGERVDLAHVPDSDPATYDVIRSTQTVGVFQVESPGQRALGGKLCPASMTDLTAQISLFRPGPVKADMITPFVGIRHGTQEPPTWPEELWPIVSATGGVVIWHEQVMRIIAQTSGVSLAQADLARRELGSAAGRESVQQWWRPAAVAQGYPPEQVDYLWDLLVSFGSFGFCRAHAAAFARTTFESAWLKTHYPAEFFAGLLTHSPGLYPTEVLLAEARRVGVQVEGPCVQSSQRGWSVVADAEPQVGLAPVPGLPVPAASTAVTSAAVPRCTGATLRAPLSAVAGLSVAEEDRLLAGRPYSSLADVWHRARPSSVSFDRLALVGALAGVVPGVSQVGVLAQVASIVREQPLSVGVGQGSLLELPEVQEVAVSGFVGAQVSVGAAQEEFLGLSVAGHRLAPWVGDLRARGVVAAADLVGCVPGSSVLVAGVRSVVHTPPTRSGVRVVFVTLDDPSGLVDVVFFPADQGVGSVAAMTSELVVVQGVVELVAPRSVSVVASRSWPLNEWLFDKP